MAQFDHIVATKTVKIHGDIAFLEGDPIPVDTAKRLGIKGTVVKGVTPDGDGDFADGELTASDADSKSGAPTAPRATKKD